MEEQTEQAAPAKSGGRSKLIIVAALVLVVGGGAGWWFMRGTPAAAEVEEVDPSTRGLVSFTPFLVNLSDGGGSRFLKITVQVVVGTADDAKHAEESAVITAQARSAVLEILTQQVSTTLVTPEGKDALRKALIERLSHVFPKEIKVIDVLFADFVVQF